MSDTIREHDYVAFRDFPNGWSITTRKNTKQEIIDDISFWEDKYLTFTQKPIVEQPSASEVISQAVSQAEPKDYWVREVKKDGPNKGKHFKVEKGAGGKFLGWTDEPLK